MKASFSDIVESSSDNESISSLHDTLFLQANEISNFLKAHSYEARTSESFQKLQSFFDIFTEQLRINFELRNYLSKYQKLEPINLSAVQKLKNDTDIFLQNFNKISLQECPDLASFTEYFINFLQGSGQIISIEKENQKLCKLIKKQTKDISKLQNEFNISQELLEQKLTSIQKENQAINFRITQYQNTIKDLEKSISLIETRLNEKNEKKRQFLQIVNEKKNQMEILQKQFQEKQEKYFLKKEKLENALARLKIEKVQLENNEKPLADALEEAEMELQSIESTSRHEIEKILVEVEKVIASTQEKEILLNQK